MKTCKHCHEEKHSILDFSLKSSTCRTCVRDKMRVYRSKLGTDPKRKWGRFYLTYNALKGA